MEYLQYRVSMAYCSSGVTEVLNLVINGIPSIQKVKLFKLTPHLF